MFDTILNTVLSPVTFIEFIILFIVIYVKSYMNRNDINDLFMQTDQIKNELQSLRRDVKSLSRGNK